MWRECVLPHLWVTAIIILCGANFSTSNGEILESNSQIIEMGRKYDGGHCAGRFSTFVCGTDLCRRWFWRIKGNGNSKKTRFL